MGVILGEAPDPHESVEDAGLFVAVDRAELGPAAGQLPVGTGLGLVDHDVERAVHRLDVVRVAVDVHARIHVLLVESEVP